MPAPLILRIIGDATSYFKTAETTIGVNTKLAASFGRIGPEANVTANAVVAAAVRSLKAQEAQLAGLRSIQAQAVAGSREQIAATVAVANAEARLNRSMGISTVGIGRAGAASKEAERDFGKLTRGALAGSGVFSALGRSLAFASGGFLAVAGGAALISKSIHAALDLAAAQKQIDQQLRVSGKSWAQYGKQIDDANVKLLHIAGFTDVELLQSFTTLFRATGEVTQSLHLNAVAADVARGRHIGLAAASNALAKAAEGSFAALRRLNIIVPQGSTTMEALAFVQEKYAGQAQAGATAADRFRASLIHTEDIIGTALLPTFNRLVTRLGDWLAKANESGRIQRDANEALKIAGDVFHTLGGALKVVDTLTGSFANTLKALIGLKVASTLAGWLGSIGKLQAAWGGVTVAATEAAAAERIAAGGGLPGRSSGVAGRVGMYTGAAAGGAVAGTVARGGGSLSRAAGAVRGFIVVALADLVAQSLAVGAARFSNYLGGTRFGRAIGAGNTPLPPGVNLGNIVKAHADALTGRLTAEDRQVLVALEQTTGAAKSFAKELLLSAAIQHQINENIRHATGTNLLGAPGLSPILFPGGPSARGGFLPGVKPIPQITTFALTPSEQLAQAQASLTRSTTDDVAGAKQVVARIKRLIDHGRLHGQALVDALNAEASAIGTIWSAEDAAAQKRAAAAQAAKARIQAQIEDSIDPLRLEVALSRAQALGQPLAPTLRKIRASAEAALASGKLSLEQQGRAWDEIKSINDQLASQAQAFQVPLRLQLALAKAQALGTDQHAILERMKAALERALKKAKGNVQAQIDLWNQIGSINQQLGSSAASALGDFKQLNINKIAKGLHLTAAQAKALKAQLSQIGPGGTVPGHGTGAYGYVIGAGGRPEHHHHHHHLYIDGKPVESSVSAHQQKRRSQNSSQRRGPNAGMAY